MAETISVTFILEDGVTLKDIAECIRARGYGEHFTGKFHHQLGTGHLWVIYRGPAPGWVCKQGCGDPNPHYHKPYTTYAAPGPCPPYGDKVYV